MMRSYFRPLLTRLPRVYNLFWLAPILALALGLRLYRIGANSLWFDEAFSWLVIQHSPWSILTQRLEPFLPPLYHVLLYFWSYLGDSEVVLRSFSAVCGVMTVPVMYILGRELFTPAAGLAAAFLAAVLPFHIYFAQEARPYALIILLSALVLWGFVRAWKSTSHGLWASLGLLAGVSLYAHYFLIFQLAVFHGFVLLVQPREKYRWRGLLLSDFIITLIFIPRLSLAWAQTYRVTTDFWVSIPSPLQPIKTLVFLLFSHTTPLWLVPAALFLTLSIFILVIWAIVRARGQVSPWPILLVALMVVPMLLALLISWTISPIYLDRSFSLITPAYVLLLGWGLTHPPRNSPLPLLFGGLLIVVAVSLSTYYIKPDPAKPPFREVSGVLRNDWREKDVLLNLHDSSYMPLRYYVPELDSHVFNNDPDSWIPVYTWEWVAGRVVGLDEVVAGKSRLWLLVMPRRLNDKQTELLAQIEARYHGQRQWVWSVTDTIELRLYSLVNPKVATTGDCAAWVERAYEPITDVK